MKKIFAIFVAMLFVASLSFAVVGCKKAEETAKRKTQAKPAAKAVKQVKETNSAEKTTLGDISELAALRSQMEADEQKEN